MTKGALDANRSQALAVIGQKAGHSNHRIGFQQHESARRVGEIDFTFVERIDHFFRKGADIDLESEFKGLLRAYPRTHTAELFTHDGLMQLESSAPKTLTAEGVIPKNLFAVFQQLFGIGRSIIVIGFAARLSEQRDHPSEGIDARLEPSRALALEIGCQGQNSGRRSRWVRLNWSNQDQKLVNA